MNVAVYEGFGRTFKAVQIDDANKVQIMTWSKSRMTINSDGEFVMYVPTINGVIDARVGDWIAKNDLDTYVYSDENFQELFVKTDERKGGNTDLQHLKETPRQFSEKRKVQADHGTVIRLPGK